MIYPCRTRFAVLWRLWVSTIEVWVQVARITSSCSARRADHDCVTQWHGMIEHSGPCKLPLLESPTVGDIAPAQRQSHAPNAYRLAGVYAAYILNGENPGELPIQPATKGANGSGHGVRGVQEGTCLRAYHRPRGAGVPAFQSIRTI